MVGAAIERIHRLFSEARTDHTWSFAELSQADTTYGTHSYHRYPAKFIPQLAARLIELYSREGETILDPFMGSGTTLVEAKRLRRPSIGTDINPVAHLIARAKVQAFAPHELREAIRQLKSILSFSLEPTLFNSAQPPLPRQNAYSERLQYWFPENVLNELERLQRGIMALEERFQPFFLCALSHILKSVSYWHDRSIKPTRKLDKKIPPVFPTFWRQVQRMERGDAVYYHQLREASALNISALPLLADSRALPLPDESVHCTVTSPPYVTSYEYADLHQLSVLWFGWTQDLRDFRSKFIGTGTCGDSPSAENLLSPTAREIVERLTERSRKKASEVSQYFHDMTKSLKEIRRVLTPGGYACIVIGDTTFFGVEVHNGIVFAEIAEELGMQVKTVILREIPSKILPQTRDKATGRFTAARLADYLAYPTENILVLQK